MPVAALTKFVCFCPLFFVPSLLAQSSSPDIPTAESSGGTSTDLFIMFDSDLVRPDLEPKANYNRARLGLAKG
jgi:hypothetical protein